MSLRQAFALEGVRRQALLAGGSDKSDLLPLYDPVSGNLTVPDRSPWVPRDHAVVPVPAPRAVRLAPNLTVFRTLFRCFAGAVADLTLPRGAFFTGSAVLAAATLPTRLRSRELLGVLHACGAAEEGPKHVATMCLMRRLAPKSALVDKVMSYVGVFIDAQEVRSRVEDAQPENIYPAMEEDDVLRWTNNGYGPYARSDIDIMVRCKTHEEGDRIVHQLYGMLKNVDGNPSTVIRTANTVTFARSWPERHVQVVLYVMPQVSSLLLFADLDCTAMAIIGGVPMTTTRSRRALELKINLVPVLMLENRRDTPKRVAAYVKRGFASVYLEDSRLPDATLGRIRILQRRVAEALVFERKLLDLLVLSDGDLVDEEAVATYLAGSNTSYSSTNIPRMAELTSHGIERFFQKLGPTSAASLMAYASQLPRTQSKMGKVAQETWVAWGMA